jgi:hypothetical protein
MAGMSTIAPTAVRLVRVQRLTVPRPSLGASLAAMFGVLGDAVRMAYADPYASRRPNVAPEEGQDGRDPRW